MLPFDDVAFHLEQFAHAVAQVALNLDEAVPRRAAGSAGALELLAEIFRNAALFGRPSTTVTILPPRPFFSMRSFATMAPGLAGTDAAAARVLHLQSRCGQPQPGHTPPLPVEYTSLASLLAGFLFDTRGAQDVGQPVVALVARVFVHGALVFSEAASRPSTAWSTSWDRPP